MDEKLYCHVCKEFKETSHKGYTKDNIWLICSAVNFMKSNLNLEEFKQYCQAVINYKK